MDEASVKSWLEQSLGVSRETVERIDRFVALLREESGRQNLIARSTLDTLWDRHIRDSAQLYQLADPELRSGNWIDLGSGPGLPGIVLALIGNMPITLVEMRTKRVEFLHQAIEALELDASVTVEGCRLERVETQPFDVITARAFTALPKLLTLAHRFSTPKTQWVLPKGRTAQEELEQAERSWQGDFALTPSQTSDDAFIVTAHNVRPGRRS